MTSAQGHRTGWAVIDLFCGVGGLSHGFYRAGFRIAAGIDADITCRYAFETNNYGVFIGRPLEEISADEIRALYPEGDRRILIGCAPCAPFSAYTPERKKRRNDKWGLLSIFAERISQLQPDVVSMENVPRLASFEGGSVLQEFVDKLAVDYHVTVQFVDCRDYGVPQSRLRLVLLASKLGVLSLEPPQCKKPRTVRDAIGHLPPLRHGETHPSDRLHRSAALSSLNLKRIQLSKPSGTWEDWPIPLRAKCHRRRSGWTFRNVYGRMSWDDVAPTITTGCYGYGRGRFGHPDQDRAISLREAALLQTFPPQYSFVADNEDVSMTAIGRHIGNAVPVALGEAIARTIVKHVSKDK